MSEVVPVSFANRSGLTLFGLLHLPPKERRREVAVMLLSPGVKMRVAPHRLYLKLAEHFTSLGFPVLRFDYYGLGDSEGELEDDVLVQVYNSIQDGRYVADTVDAMNWLQARHGFSRFIAGGLCGGAISGLLAAEQDPRIEALWALGIPSSFEGTGEHYDRFLTRGELKSLSRGYLRKLLRPKSLIRFFTFRSSYGVIFRSFRERLRGTGATPAVQAPSDSSSNYNPKFGRAFISMVASARPVLLIFSGADRWQWEFEEKFEQPNAARLNRYPEAYEKHTIPSANHILSADEWLASAVGTSTDWFTRHYPTFES